MPPVWPSPRPEIIGTGTPHAATIGARISDTLSPTPPVECLSTFMPGMAERSITSPGMQHQIGEGGGLPVGHAAEVDGHEQRRHLVIRQLVLRIRRDEPPEFIRGQLAAVPFLAYQFNRIHDACR